MTTGIRRIPVILGLALAVLVPAAGRATGKKVAKATLAPEAIAFVQAMAKGNFKSAETDFTEQMKQAAPPGKLREAWESLLNQVGSFQDTGVSKTVVKQGFTTVIVKTDFKSRAIGIAVTFDSAHRIAGMHFVSPP